MNIAVIGVGYVGLVTAACFSRLGIKVTGIDSDANKIKGLQKGIIPIYEPGLDKIIKTAMKTKAITFNPSIAEGIKNAEVVFICVGTPSKPDGDADLSQVEEVCRQIAESMTSYKVIVEKSTVPVNTGEWIKRTIKLYNKNNMEFDVVSNPEFLREGTAIDDFLKPDRIVIGVESERAKNIMLKLYKSIDAPKLVTNIQSSELIKHASNSFLATKISYINAISNICEKTGADVVQIAEGMGLDKRIGRSFLNAGAGYGGSCFPKDLAAFIHIAGKLGFDFELLKSVKKINEQQKQLVLKKIEDAVWVLSNKTIGVLGLSFKPNTDDLRDSPAVEITRGLIKDGAKIRAYDPVAMKKAKQILPEVLYCKTPYEAAKGSHALAVLTDWDEFKKLDLKKIKSLLKTPVLIDARNIYDPLHVRKLGFIYKSVGRI